MTWRQQAVEVIVEATRAMPDDTPLPHRIKTVDAARPHWGGCSWPRKAWQAARRDYLARHGYRPRIKAQAEMDRAKMGELPLWDGLPDPRTIIFPSDNNSGND